MARLEARALPITTCIRCDGEGTVQRWMAVSMESNHGPTAVAQNGLETAVSTYAKAGVCV